MPPRARAQALPRRHRFTAQGSFEPVLRSGRKARGEHVVIHAARGAADASRVGVALSRRYVPSAVERNLIKRIVREAFRRHPLKTSGVDFVVAVRSRMDRVARMGLREEVGRLLDELQARMQ